MNKLIIAGAGGMGREVLWLVESINSISPAWEVLGFIDDTTASLNGMAGTVEIIGTIEQWIPKEDEYFAIAIYDNHGRELVANKLGLKGAKFASIIHPDNHIANLARIGNGCIIFDHVSVSVNTVIGDFCYFQGGAIIGDDVSVGNYVTAATRSFIGGRSTVGDFAYIGTGALIAPERKIGADALVGIGSVVIKNVKDKEHVFGNPAKRMGF